MKFITKLAGLLAVLIIAATFFLYVIPALNNSSDEESITSAQNSAGAPSRGTPGRARSTLIESEFATQALVNDRLNTIGSGKAASSVTVNPLSAGTLVEILATPGQQIEKGDVIARLDSESEVIARDRAARTARDASTNESRLTQLFKTNTTSASELDTAKANSADANLSLREAQLTLERRNVVAPISGVVGLIKVDAGNYVSTQTALATIDDRSTIIIEFWVPENFSNQLAIGQQLNAIAIAMPGQQHEGVISAMDSRIDPDSRTLLVEARLNNSKDTLRPGMSFEVQLKFTGETYTAVNPLAIQWDSEGSYIWRVVDDKAQKVSVVIIQRNPTSVLVDGDVTVDDLIITEGLLTLRPGSSVRSSSTSNNSVSKG